MPIRPRSRIAWLLIGLIPMLLIAACAGSSRTDATADSGDTRLLVSVVIDGVGQPGVLVYRSIGGTGITAAITGANGVHEFTSIQPGTHIVTIADYPARVTFRTTTLEVDVPSGRTARADFIGTWSVLQPAPQDEEEEPEDSLALP